MNCYIAERKIEKNGGLTAWSKAREDAERICAELGFGPIPVRPAAEDRVNAGLAQKVRGHFAMARIWRRGLRDLGAGDSLFLQLPAIHNCLFLAGILRRARRRGVRIVGLIHDLETLRMSLDESVSLRSRWRMHAEETSVLRVCDKLIVHNDRMAERLAAQGIPREKLVPLGIFDYLADEAAEAAVCRRAISPQRDRLIAAGNLRPDKAGYLYDLPETVGLELYGVGYEGPAERGSVRYHGAFPPGELPARLEGGFGLVWDGPTADGCRGVYGEYLRYNNPHKTSLYLAAGLPVAIWEQAALAELVTAEGVGFAAASVAEAAARAAAMPLEEYETYFRRAAALGTRLRRGTFLKKALERCL